MKQFEISVYRPKRILIGLLLFSSSFVGSIVISAKQDTLFLKIIVPLLILVLVSGLIYYFSSGKLNLSSKDGRIYFQWKRKIPFYFKQIDPIKVKEIDTLIIDPGYFLRTIIVNNQIFEVNTGKPLKKDSKMFLASLYQQVKNNNGQIIDSNQYMTIKGYNDFTFKLFIIFLAFSIFLISRLWIIFSYASLILLMLPGIFYYIHIKQRIKKKTGGNIAL